MEEDHASTQATVRTADEDYHSLPLSSAFPYEVSTPATSTFSINLRRITALGTAAVLLYLLYPLPHLTSLLPCQTSQDSAPLILRIPYLFIFLQAIDGLLETTLISTILFSAYHLALFEGSISINNKTVELKWLMPATTAAVALAAAAEDTWIKTNLLWNLILVLAVCGWMVTSQQQMSMKSKMANWVAGVALGRIGYAQWLGEGLDHVRAAVEC